MSISIRNGHPSDLPAIERWMAASKKAEPLYGMDQDAWVKARMETFERVIRRRLRGMCLVATGCGSLLGTGEGEDLRDFGIYIAPASRRMGIAGRLLSVAEQRAKQLGYRRIWATPLAGTVGVSFFEDAAFQPKQIILVKEL